MRSLRIHDVDAADAPHQFGGVTRHCRRALPCLVSLSLCLAGTASAAKRTHAKPAPPTTRAAAARAGTATSPATSATAASTTATSVTVSQRKTALSVTLVLKVADPTRAREALLKAVRKAGGRPSLITDHSLHLRVPPQRLHMLLADLPNHGLVMDKQVTRRDLTEEIARLRGRLRSKSAILARLRGFLDDSSVSATLQVERTMTTLVHEIEQLKGGLRVALDQAALAHVRLSFRFRTPTQLRYVRSPFGWIDSVDIPHFLRGF